MLLYNQTSVCFLSFTQSGMLPHFSYNETEVQGVSGEVSSVRCRIRESPDGSEIGSYGFLS